MGLIKKAKRVITQPEKLIHNPRGKYIRSRINEILLLTRRHKLGGVASYLISGAIDRSLYDEYLNYLTIRYEDNILLIDVRDYEMFIDLYDRGLSKQLYLYGTRENGPARIFEKELTKISQEIESPLIIEAGANIGYYTILEANAVHGNCEIVAIEPSKSNIDFLERNIKHNGIDNLVSIHRCAIGSETGEAELELTEHSNLHRIGNGTSTNRSTGSEEVPIWRLDEFLAEFNYDPNDVNVIRMDIEGQELNALDGMKEVLDSEGPILIYIEVHNHLLSDKDARVLSQRLSDAGFEICAVEWGRITNSPFDLSFDVDDWRDLHKIEGAYSLIAKK